MEKIIFQGVEIGFNDLSEEIQRKLYLKNKEMFKLDATKSVYPNIRRLIIEDEETSCKFLNEMLREVLKENYNKKEKEILINKLNKKMEEGTIEKLAQSSDFMDRVWAAKEEINPSKLSEMLRKEIQQSDNYDVEEVIIKNNKFKFEEKTSEWFLKSKHSKLRIIAVEKEKKSTKLNEILRREVVRYDDITVEKTILLNDNFKIENRTIKILFESKNAEIRVIAAREETNSTKLNEMLRKEVKENDNYLVEETIIQNINFKIEQETIMVLFKSKNNSSHILAAKEETDSIKLNEMLRRVVLGYDVYVKSTKAVLWTDNSAHIVSQIYKENVRDVILKNPHFKMEKGTIKMIFKSGHSYHRVAIAKAETDPLNLNKMLSMEKKGDNCTQVTNAILENPYFKSCIK